MQNSKSSEQIATTLNTKNGKGVAKSQYGKTDVRFWQGQIYKPEYKLDGNKMQSPEYAVRIQWRGRREFFHLHTANEAAAAAKAKKIYLSIIAAGWPATFAEFKPAMEIKAIATVGDFLSELRAHWAGKPKTFEDYSQKFRTMLSKMFNIDGGEAKYDYVNGGRAAWVAKIEAVKLADVTPERVNKWRIAFVKEAGESPVKQKRARISCNSILRQARSLFSPKAIVHMGKNKPQLSPFKGVEFYERESMRYKSTVDIQKLIADAQSELSPQPLKIFLLATMAGLRRNEIDKLEWAAFLWKAGAVRIEATEHFTPKTEESAADVPISPELLAMFRKWHAKATGAFVIESDILPIVGVRYTHYRAQRHFDALTAWLRSKGVNAAKPLHELRKEFGSQLCARHGIYAASLMLRHADIAITSQHYLDQKQRVTFGMGELLPAPVKTARKK